LVRSLAQARRAALRSPAAFTRALSAAACAALLTLLLRVQLNLLGSHSLLSASLAARDGGALSAHSQRAYLDSHAHFLCTGAPQLARRLAAAVRAELGATPLDARLGSAEVAALFLRLQALLLAPAPRWEALLLPPPEADARLLAEAAARGGDDARLLAALLRETREALGGAAFEAAARGALEEAGRSLLSILAPALAEGPKPLARLVPAVAAASEAALRAPGREGPEGVAAAVGRLPLIDAFSADLFSRVL